MKKYTFLFAVAAVLALTACGSGSAAKETKDSTAVSTDTTAKATDSTATAVDSTKGGAKAEEAVK
jgi:hypothetical protein